MKPLVERKREGRPFLGFLLRARIDSLHSEFEELEEFVVLSGRDLRALESRVQKLEGVVCRLLQVLGEGEGVKQSEETALGIRASGDGEF